ncbi:profilin-1 [Amia ocellicauda]|uniref:profilin-1 n=1 Tax=Amia ocellicauda TaxID=2972642 RepID=UPI003464D570|nr:PROF1 protein [Amia calva]
MSWNEYVSNLMAGNEVQDAAIAGCEPGAHSVWAAAPNGHFGKITPDELAVLMGKDRSSFFINGVTLGGVKCSVIRDRINEEGDWCMDLRTKSINGSETFNISVAKSNKAVVIIKGCKDVHGGALNKKAFDMASHLRKSNY